MIAIRTKCQIQLNVGGTKVGPRFQRMLPWPAYSSDEDGDMRPQKVLKMAETCLKWLRNAAFFILKSINTASWI